MRVRLTKSEKSLLTSGLQVEIETARERGEALHRQGFKAQAQASEKWAELWQKLSDYMNSEDEED